jgi:hypothetical protein
MHEISSVLFFQFFYFAHRDDVEIKAAFASWPFAREIEVLLVAAQGWGSSADLAVAGIQ